jgi:SAM-dependent methyltransferase
VANRHYDRVLILDFGSQYTQLMRTDGQRDRQTGRMAKALKAPSTGRGLRRMLLVDAVAVWLGGKPAASKSARYELLYALPWAEVTTNNYGFAPAPGDHPERFQLQMYAELHKRLLAAGGSAGARLLEISCGRGGGLRHLVALWDDDLFAVGFDLSNHAIRFCHAHHGRPGRLAFVRGDALRLPFDDSSFDVVVNVEASHAYGDDAALLAEVRRVLTPGGAFLYADSRRAAKLGCLEQQVREAGFTGELADITEHVSLACELDRERRQALIRRGVPWYWRILLGRRLAQYAALPGSPKFEAFRTRERVYFMGCLAAPPDPARRRCARWRRSARRERRCASPGGAA